MICCCLYHRTLLERTRKQTNFTVARSLLTPLSAWGRRSLPTGKLVKMAKEVICEGILLCSGKQTTTPFKFAKKGRKKWLHVDEQLWYLVKQSKIQFNTETKLEVPQTRQSWWLPLGRSCGKIWQMEGKTKTQIATSVPFIKCQSRLCKWNKTSL